MHPAREGSLVLWVTGPGADRPETRDVLGIGLSRGIDFASLISTESASSRALQDSAAGTLKRTGCTDAVVGDLQYQQPFWLNVPRYFR